LKPAGSRGKSSLKDSSQRPPQAVVTVRLRSWTVDSVDSLDNSVALSTSYSIGVMRSDPFQDRSGSTTLDDVSKHKMLLAREWLSVCIESLEDIRQFQMWPSQGVWVVSVEELVPGRSWGLVVERSANVDACR